MRVIARLLIGFHWVRAGESRWQQHHANIYLSCPKTSHSSHELNSTFQLSAAPTLPTVEQCLPFTAGRDPSLDTTKELYQVRTQQGKSWTVWVTNPKFVQSKVEASLSHESSAAPSRQISKWWMSKIQMLNALVWIIQFWCGAASWKLIWFLLGFRSCPMLDLSDKKLEVQK